MPTRSSACAGAVATSRWGCCRRSTVTRGCRWSRVIGWELDLLGSHGMAAADYPDMIALIERGLAAAAAARRAHHRARRGGGAAARLRPGDRGRHDDRSTRRAEPSSGQARVRLERRPPVGVLARRPHELEARGRHQPPLRPTREQVAGAARGAAAARGRRCGRPRPRCRRTRPGGRAGARSAPQTRLSAHWVTRRPSRVSRSPAQANGTVVTAALTTPAATRRRARYDAPAARRPRAACGRARVARLGLVARGEAVGQRELHDRAQRLAVLPVQRADGVGQVVLGAQLLAPARTISA